GPQGTLFGKNTIGGAVNIVSAKPDDEFHGAAEATFGSYDRTDFRGSVNLPVSDGFYSKFALSYKNRDGYGKRLDFATGETIDRAGDEDQIAGRAAFRWEASDAVMVDLSFDYSHWDQGSVPTQLLQFDDAGAMGGLPTILWNALIGFPSGMPMSSAFITGDPDTTYGTGPNRSDLDAWGVHGTIEWDLGWATLKSITAYREMDAQFGRDG